MDFEEARIERRPPVGTGEIGAFTAIYEESFPATERDDTPKLLSSIDAGERVCYLTLVDGVVVGLAVVLPMTDLSVGLLEYFAIGPPSRDHGLGGRLLTRVRAELPELSSCMDGLLLEVEPPLDGGGREGGDGEGGEESRLRRRRIAFYERNGACLVEGAPRYRVPDFTGSGTLPFWLMWLPVPDGVDRPPAGELLREYVAAILARSYGMDEDDPLLRAVVADVPC